MADVKKRARSDFRYRLKLLDLLSCKRKLEQNRRDESDAKKAFQKWKKVFLQSRMIVRSRVARCVISVCQN